MTKEQIEEALNAVENLGINGLDNKYPKVLAAAVRSSQEEIKQINYCLDQRSQQLEEKFEELKVAQARIIDLTAERENGEAFGWAKHKLAVVSLFRLKAAEQQDETIGKIFHAWADMIGELKYE